MTFVRQRRRTDCGIAALAMLCDVTYEEAERAIPFRRSGSHRGTTTKQLREGGAKLGYETESTPQHRLKPLGPTRDWYDIPENSLVKMPKPTRQRGWHWVVWRGGKVYDPARGVFRPEKYDNIPSSYMEFKSCMR